MFLSYLIEAISHCTFVWLQMGLFCSDGKLHDKWASLLVYECKFFIENSYYFPFALMSNIFCQMCNILDSVSHP